MNTNSLRLMAALVAFGSASCTTSRWYDTRYQPAPLEALVTATAVPGSQVRALVSVLGIARPSAEEGHGDQVEIRLRLENLGTAEAKVVEDGFSLVSADLVPFAKPVFAPNTAPSVPPGETRTIDCAFPAPEHPLDWSGLNLRFALSFADVRVTTGATFNALVYLPYDPVHWHVGVGYTNSW
jgi:hypothetical protein